MSFSILRNLIITATVFLAIPAWACQPITGCGTLAVAGASYCAASGTVFTLNSITDCIIIAAPNVTLTMDSAEIDGSLVPHGGNGIHILSAATNAILNLTGDTEIGSMMATRPLHFGIKDEARNTTIMLSGLIQAIADDTSVGIYLHNASNTTLRLDGNVSGATYGLWISGGQYNVVVSPTDPIDGTPLGGFDGELRAIYIQASSHNVINHIFAAGPEGITLDTAPGNMVYNNLVEGDPYGIRAMATSPNNFIEKNAVLTPDGDFDLFQGTSRTTIGCNGDYWANNISRSEDDGSPDSVSTNQPCVTASQAASAY